jgi:dTDP-4-amino-4,6-dideoxygalactose transaminase
VAAAFLDISRGGVLRFPQEYHWMSARTITKFDPVPFFKPSIGKAEVHAVSQVLRSGWLTSGERCEKFERAFAEYLGAKHAVALNSCTAALHLALEAVGVGEGDLVLVPTMTFAATAEVVHHLGGTPVLVDCEGRSLCMHPVAARETLKALARGQAPPGMKQRRGASGARPGNQPRGRTRNTRGRDRRTIRKGTRRGLETPFGTVLAMVPVHYAGQMADVGAFRDLAAQYNLSLIEDAAHALPAAYRRRPSSPWRSVGTTGDITCFSFYANKTITTGEGGMAVTDSEEWAARMRVMSLHGMSRDAWNRYTLEGSWYYEIVAAGYKCNFTDICAAIGICQLRRADRFARRRQAVAEMYSALLADVSEIELPNPLPNRKHAWHLYVIRLAPNRSRISRAEFVKELRERGIGTSVHWMPLHMHPYYRNTFGFQPEDFPVACREYERIVSLPIYPSLTDAQVRRVVSAIKAAISSKGSTSKGLVQPSRMNNKGTL